ncbi:MAG: crotonase/enoyl-CoA hydratase family protein [Acidimicrobiia bacterium]|nr:crotonase/enoyl-CoA hydratase family protein [Acidimicrobiia bacterium]
MSVTYEAQGRVAVVTVDRPERRNAIDRATAVGLKEAWQRFDADDEVYVGVLYGAGAVFSAGADLKAFDLVKDRDGFLGFTLMRVGKPTIAAVEGYCVAGGLEMALWCDLRVAANDAVFGCFERRWGVPLVDGGTQRLPLVVGLGRALDMILTGRAVDADEALQMGLVNRVVPPGAALEAAIALAEEIAAFPQATVRTDRAAVLDGLELEGGFGHERAHGLEALQVAAQGAARFAGGEGRHGQPAN